MGALVARPMGRRFGTARAILAADAGGLSCALLLPLTAAGPRLACASAAMICVAGALATALGIRGALWILTALIAASGLSYLLPPMRQLRDLPRRPARTPSS